MLTAFEQGVKGGDKRLFQRVRPVLPDQGPSTRVSVPEGGPLTGEPDAVNPHVRFGGRGVRNKSGLSYLYCDKSPHGHVARKNCHAAAMAERIGCGQKLWHSNRYFSPEHPLAMLYQRFLGGQRRARRPRSQGTAYICKQMMPMGLLLNKHSCTPTDLSPAVTSRT